MKILKTMHVTNVHLKKWDIVFVKTDPAACDSTTFKLQICFASKGEHDTNAWIMGSKSTENEPKLLVPCQTPCDPQREIELKEIRKMYLDVSHRWKNIARFLPGRTDGFTGLQD